MSRIDAVRRMRGSLANFVTTLAGQESTAREVFDRLEVLEDIVYGRRREFWFLSDRLAAIERWLLEQGPALRQSALTQDHLNHITACIEKIKDVRDREQGDPRQVDYVNKVLELTNSFAMQAAKRLRLEYSPLGLVPRAEPEAPHVDDLDRWKTLEAIRSVVPKSDTTKKAFEATIKYQMDMLTQFYVREESLLSVLDFQLRNLEARYTPEDELLAASLLYFLKMKKYKITAYYNRFRSIIDAREAAKER